MDSSWIHGYATANTTAGNNSFTYGYAASCTPAELQHREEEEEQIMSSQIQHHLNQISMHMNMDDEGVVYDGALDMPVVDSLLDPHHASSCFPSSSSSSSLSRRSASVISCSPESSAHILGGGAPAAEGACGQYPEVSSHVPLPPAAAPYVDHHHHQYANTHVPAAKRGAFKRYERHLGPRWQPKPGACRQRMFKTALSVLSKMDMAAKYSQQQYYYQQASAEASAAVPPPTVNQLQHMISERKRREKLNDSFHALKAVLPPGNKKDKTSILIGAREHIRSLKLKASKLEERNKSLEEKNRSLETRLAQRGGIGDDDEKVQIEITRAAKEVWPAIEPRDLCTLKIVVRSRCNMTDVVLRTLQCLKEKVGDDVNLVSMNTSGSVNVGPSSQTCSSPRAILTMQIKSPGANWDEQPVKDAVAKVVADALRMPSGKATTAPQLH